MNASKAQFLCGLNDTSKKATHHLQSQLTSRMSQNKKKMKNMYLNLLTKRQFDINLPLPARTCDLEKISPTITIEMNIAT